MQTVSFPALGLEFTLNRVAFQIGDFQIYWYGIIIAAAFLCGITYMLCRVKDFGLDGDRAIDVILGAAVGAIIGARAYYVIFSWDQYQENWLDIFNPRLGGIAIYGGVIGGFLAGWLMCKWRRVKFLPMADLAMSGVILGQAIGRWGNFVNVEAFGSNTDLPWGMTAPGITAYLRENLSALSALHVDVDPTMPVHPTFLYESLWCLIGFLFLFFFTKRRRFDGELVLLYVFWYGLGRAWIEGLRTDSLLLGTLRVSQLLAVLCVAGALILWLAVRSRIRNSADPEYLQLYVNTEEGQSVLAGTFYEKKNGTSGGETDPAAIIEEPEEKPQEEEGPSEEGEGPGGEEPESGDPQSRGGDLPDA